jgi:hypothetical protein
MQLFSVVVMDKKSLGNSGDILRGAKQLQDTAVTIIPVAFGSEANPQELLSLTPSKRSLVTSTEDESPDIIGEKIMINIGEGMYHLYNFCSSFKLF